MLKAMFSRTFLVAEATSSSGTASSAAFHTELMSLEMLVVPLCLNVLRQTLHLCP